MCELEHTKPLRTPSTASCSDELSRLRMDIVGFSETRRPGSDEISSGSLTYYWSGMSNGARLKGVAIGISSRLQPSVVNITPVDECIM